MPSTCDQFICDLCMESISESEPQVRIGVDSVVRNQDGSYSSLVKNQVLVFAVFHSECVHVTLGRDDCDDVPYIEEARMLLTTFGADAKIIPQDTSQQEPKIKRHLVCLQGGVRA